MIVRCQQHLYRSGCSLLVPSLASRILVIRERKKERDPIVNPSRIRVGLETAVALVAGLLGIITIFWHDWIEALTGWDPDHHNGSFEWLIVAALLAVAIVVGVVA